MKYKPKDCGWCGSEFEPHSTRQLRCDDCRAKRRTEVGRCRDCGSPISGRGRWPIWGGECDRAEERVDALERLLTTTGGPR